MENKDISIAKMKEMQMELFELSCEKSYVVYDRRNR